MDPPVLSVVVPTRGRAAYLEVTLDSLLDQRTETAYEIVVVDDGAADATAAVVAARPTVRYVAHGEGRGLNAARNTGLRESQAELIAFVDDDVLVPSGWVDALVAGSRRHPEAEAFGGPIRARFEGRTPRGCGREEPPITTLDLGAEDREATKAWGANFAVRRAAVERVGPFDERIVRPHGDEEEWIERLRASGGTVVYLAERGTGPPAHGGGRAAGPAGARRLRARTRRLGRATGVASERRRSGRELRVLGGCVWHTARRGCPQGLIMGAHSAGRVVETLRPLPALRPDSR